MLQGERAIVGSDHEPVLAVTSLASPALRYWRKPLRNHLKGHKCGKWVVDFEGLNLSADQLADDLAQDAQAPLNMKELENIVQKHSYRPKHARYVDPLRSKS